MRRRFTSRRASLLTLMVSAWLCAAVLLAWPEGLQSAQDAPLLTQTRAMADAKSAGCVSCHTYTDEPTMHATRTVRLGCADCHGGDYRVGVPAGAAPGSPEYERAKRQAHPQPRFAEHDRAGANPVRAYTRWLREDLAWIRFVNPGDLRVADVTCGTSGCHGQEVQRVRTSMMTHGAMLWGAALYNNSSFPLKNAHFGESYAADGTPQRLVSVPPPTPEETRLKGVLPYLDPLPRWEVSEPGNVLRVFERGGRERAEPGLPPFLFEEPGKPDVKVSDRGLGTLLRTDPVILGLQKTRLFDPLLHFPGTNDQPGDYRHSGCTACHVVYANDTSPTHAGPYAVYGNRGMTATADPTIPRNRSGHPIRHVFTRSIPSSQCMVCHMHPGTNMVASYFGYTWWDNETDGARMYHERQNDPGEREKHRVRLRNPEGSAPRGRWADVEFLKKLGTPEFNAGLEHTQFAAFHSHGWIFRAVFKRDRRGHLLDADGSRVSHADPQKFEKAVHLKDIHLEKGMHCVDCHFTQDSHGDGRLYGETRAAIEVDCIDCHGTLEQRATLRTSGPAAPEGGTSMAAMRTPWKERRFSWQDGRLWQRSVVERDLKWPVPQVADTVTPGAPDYNERSRLAKALLRDGNIWSAERSEAEGRLHEASQLAHSNQKMTCYSCHTSWTTSCFGCHLSMTANNKMPTLHNEGLTTRNWTSYNFMVLRDDAYMLGVDGTVTGNRVAPVRSACAVVVSSQNENRAWLYYAQQTVASPGFSGHAFSPYVPHTVRGRETRTCSDCHVSAAGDNNAWMASVLLQGTNFVNHMGRWVYVANGDRGLEAVAVAELDEPPAVLGSDLHAIAYPDDYRRHLAGGARLSESHHHRGREVLDVQLRGEYLYAAMGARGFRVYDVAQIQNKDFSERIVTAPVSPLGQRLYVRTRYATSVGSPSTLAIDPSRQQFPENEEQPIHPMYGYLYVTDRYEGLVVVGGRQRRGAPPGVATLLDGEPRNNFLSRRLAFNPDGLLNGASRIAFAGRYAYILANRGLMVVDLDDPLNPRITATVGAPALRQPRGLAIQFRYAFVVDADGLKVLDITALDRPQPVAAATLALEDARNIYVARTYAYVAAGRNGMAIVDVERPEAPRLDRMFDADGALSDVNDVKLGMTNASLFAYVADGRNGLRVVQLISPGTTPNHYGFSPRPEPRLIATYRTRGPALAVSEGTHRDRAVDESGNQLAVFGRRGSRPFNFAEMQRLYLRDGTLYTVTDPPLAPAVPRAARPQRGLAPASKVFRR